jgi:hypothetical protein
MSPPVTDRSLCFWLFNYKMEMNRKINTRHSPPSIIPKNTSNDFTDFNRARWWNSNWRDCCCVCGSSDCFHSNPISTSICFVDSFNRWCDWQHTKQTENLSLSYSIPLVFHYVLHNRREYINQSKRQKSTPYNTPSIFAIRNRPVVYSFFYSG